jgi:hypothetical protein
MAVTKAERPFQPEPWLHLDEGFATAATWRRLGVSAERFAQLHRHELARDDKWILGVWCVLFMWESREP